MLRLAALHDREEPIVAAGPCWAARVAVIASWWMLREIELANAVIDDATFDGDAASLRLAVSKTDQQAKGTTRSLRCTCGAGAVASCPRHLLAAQVAFARQAADRAGKRALAAPLFPGTGSAVIAKTAVAITVTALATALELEIVDARTAAPRFSGHSFRATGAVFMASSGIDVWRIQLHGRWGSSTVLRYVRSAPLATNLALEATLKRDLEAIREEVRACQANADKGTPSDDTSLQALVDLVVQDTGGGNGALPPPTKEAFLASDAGASLRNLRSPVVGEALIRFTHGKTHGYPVAARYADDVELPTATACGYTVPRRKGIGRCEFRRPLDSGIALCRKCFGAPGEEEAAPASSAASSNCSSSSSS